MARLGVLSHAARERSGSVMISEDLRRKNASLHDRIEQVLELQPELRDGTEAMALSQDLHVEVGAPFLERTQDKLQDRARALIEHRPELAFFFDDLLPVKTEPGHNPVKPSSPPR
jgi:hypothetical protein